MTILISAANSDISDSLCRIHKEFYPKEKVIGIAPDGLWPASAVFDKVYKIGTIQDSSYLTTLLTIVEEENIKYFFPVSEHELRFFLQKEIEWSSSLKILTNPPHVLSACLNKKNTYKWLSEMGLRCPKTMPLEKVKQGDLPIFVKPVESAGSKNSFVVHTWDFYLGLLKELEYRAIPFESMIAQEYLDDEEHEYTCAISNINEESNFLILKRKLIGGITGKATICYHSKILETLQQISHNIKDNFFINVQLRLVNNIPFIFEINPRFSSTVMLRHMVGFQDFIWHVKALRGETIPVYSNVQEAQMFRVFREIVI